MDIIKLKKPTPMQTPSPAKPKKRKGFLKLIIILLVVLLIIWGGIRVYPSIFPDVSSDVSEEVFVPDPDKYQAVFLTNGQVYFGRLSIAEGDYVKLSSVYYVQTRQPDEEGNPDIRFVELSSEFHEPENIMYINKEQILLFENLRSDSSVTQAIELNNSQKQ